MSELTPERVRDAAEVQLLVNECLGRYRDAAQFPSSMLLFAERLEREQDAKAAERDMRIDEIAHLIAGVELPNLKWTEISAQGQRNYREAGSAIVDKFPCLLTEDGES